VNHAPAIKFNLHSNRAYLAPGAPHVPILIPFWGPTPEDPVTSARYEKYASSGSQFFSTTSLESCDAAIFPTAWERIVDDELAQERAAAFVAEARAAGKPPVIFFWSDSAVPVALDAMVFRTSLYRSRRQPGEFAQPAWAEDLLEHRLGGTFRLRELRDRPVVGFCGFASREPPIVTRLDRLRRRIGDRRRSIDAGSSHSEDGVFTRARALGALEKHPDVDTNFIFRDGFWGGMTPSSDIELRLRVRQEYVQNIADSDYVLCARGGGNFSYRLYETLSCGRIPVFIDTDCVLPLESVIEWKDYCVWVDGSDVKETGNRVASFHASLTPAEFTERQQACRRLWETHLSPEGFFAHFHEHFA
jgi:hypothetical protein